MGERRAYRRARRSSVPTASIGDQTRDRRGLPLVCQCHRVSPTAESATGPSCTAGASSARMASASRPTRAAGRRFPQIGRVMHRRRRRGGRRHHHRSRGAGGHGDRGGVKLDNLIQVAHNVTIGAHTAIAACTGIAGSAKIGRHCTIGGAAMIFGHIEIADGTRISTNTLITKSLPKPGTYTSALPFSEHEVWQKNAVHLRNLDKLVERIKQLERNVSTNWKANHEHEHRGGHAVPAAPLPLPADRPGQLNSSWASHIVAHQERDHQRTVLSRPFSRPPGHAGCAHPGSPGAGRGHPFVQDQGLRCRRMSAWSISPASTRARFKQPGGSGRPTGAQGGDHARTCGASGNTPRARKSTASWWPKPN